MEPSSTPREPHSGWPSFANVEPTEQELRDIQRQEDARDSRVDNTPLMKSAWAMMMVSHRWFGLRADAVRAVADAVLREALDIAQWDGTFVAAKLSRALHGRDARDHDDDVDDDPVQNDWNGSAKVALISLERSEAAWQVIAQSTGDVAAADLVAQVAELRREVEQTFPSARRFIRPGFDEPHR